MSHWLHLNVLGSLARLMDIVLVLNSPFVGFSLPDLSDLGDPDVELEAFEVVGSVFCCRSVFVGSSVSSGSSLLSRLGVTSVFSVGVEGTGDLGLSTLVLSPSFGAFGSVSSSCVASGSVTALLHLFVLFKSISCCMATLFALGYLLLSSGTGAGSFCS